ncbi:MAG: bifunctional folylpolyglutamate synthase/dihydrofolate synthase [Elusimicrobia bacterium]|nr:bifunctional folylpolyglutamate synthase/dihydrofolate synthase [Elusimicrobiota bacterium]
MTFEEAQKILIERQSFVKKNGLERVYRCLEKLGNPQDKIKCVHITGTNGKGSTAAMFDGILRAAGYKTGLYTSPHLIDIRERIRLDGNKIEKEEFARIFQEVFENGEDLSFFEIITCMAFVFFCRKGVDIAALEVGIGGRLDTTNVIRSPVLCVITSVDIDHTKFLGNDLYSIGWQKAGIMKKRSVCISPRLKEEVENALRKSALETESGLVFVDPFFRIEEYGWDSGRMKILNRNNGKNYEVGVIGDKQALNASIAVEGIRILAEKGFAVSEEAIRNGFKNLNWPGRFQIIVNGGRVFILDGAHNMEAMESFIHTFQKSPFYGRDAAFVFGMLMEKDYKNVLKFIAPHVSRIVFTASDYSRALDPHLLSDEFSKVNNDCDIEVHSSIEAALESASKSKYAAVIGSFYLVGAALEILQKSGVEKV